MHINSLVVDDDDGQSIVRPEWTKASMFMYSTLQ